MTSMSLDLDVLKGTPGYHAILKTVVKSLIQILLEQLSENTSEESLILTASVNDRSLSHLGSSLGKGFLDGREDIKSQFLGYCLTAQQKQQSDQFLHNYVLGPVSGNNSTQPYERPSSMPLFPTQTQTFDRDDYGSVPAYVTVKTEKPDNTETETLDLGASIKLEAASDSDIELTDVEEASNGALDYSLVPGYCSPPGKIQNNDVSDVADAVVHNRVAATTCSDTEPSQQSHPDTPSTPKLEINDDYGSVPVYVTVKTEKPDNTETATLDLGASIKLEAASDSDIELTGVEEASNGALDFSLVPGYGLPPGQMQNNDLPGVTDVVVHNRVAASICSDTEPMQQSHSYTPITPKLNDGRNNDTPDMDDSVVIDGLESSFEIHTEPSVDPTKLRKTYMCDQCSSSFVTKWGMKLHQRTIHEKTFRWTCLVCQKGFNILYNYKGHLASHGRMFREKCSECNETFQYHSSYLEHLKTVHKNEQFVCKKADCGKGFASVRALREHIRASHEGIAIRCKVCGKAYKWRSSLKYHFSKCHVNQ